MRNEWRYYTKCTLVFAEVFPLNVENILKQIIKQILNELNMMPNKTIAYSYSILLNVISKMYGIYLYGNVSRKIFSD